MVWSYHLANGQGDTLMLQKFVNAVASDCIPAERMSLNAKGDILLFSFYAFR